jgi:hypothetical protein
VQTKRAGGKTGPYYGRLSIIDKLVTNTLDGGDVFFADFLTDLADVNIDGAVAHDGLVAQTNLKISSRGEYLEGFGCQ